MELLVINWGNTMTIVGLGFGVVFVILAFLVIVLNLWQKIVAKKTVNAGAENFPPKVQKNKIAPVAKGTNDVAAIATALHLCQNAASEEMAAIATALHLYFGDAHDLEPAILTIRPNQNSAWNAKQFNMNNLKR